MQVFFLFVKEHYNHLFRFIRAGTRLQTFLFEITKV